MDQGNNLTNRPGWIVVPAHPGEEYDEYAKARAAKEAGAKAKT